MFQRATAAEQIELLSRIDRIKVVLVLGCPYPGCPTTRWLNLASIMEGKQRLKTQPLVAFVQT
jgi:hypothetical protein